jgi:hypothetical protein
MAEEVLIPNSYIAEVWRDFDSTIILYQGQRSNGYTLPPQLSVKTCDQSKTLHN